MFDRHQRCSRRKFLASAAPLTFAGGIGSTSLRAAEANPTPDYHVAGRWIYGYGRDGQLHVPKHYVAAMSVDQTPDNDLSREIGKEFDIRVSRSVTEALTNNTDKLAVDGVLLIAEHGNYPRNDR